MQMLRQVNTGFTRRCIGQLLKSSPGQKEFLLRPNINCSSPLSTFGGPLCCDGAMNNVHIQKKKTNFTLQITITRSASRLPPPSPGSLIIARKAKMFTRSVDGKSMDGIVWNMSEEYHEGEEHVVISFGKYCWHCRRPERSRYFYELGQHVRVTPVTDPSNCSPLDPVLVMQAELPLKEEDWSTPFPWKLSPSEKTIYFYCVYALLFIPIVFVSMLIAMALERILFVGEGVNRKLIWWK